MLDKDDIAPDEMLENEQQRTALSWGMRETKSTECLHETASLDGTNEHILIARKQMKV